MNRQVLWVLAASLGVAILLGLGYWMSMGTRVVYVP